MLMETAAAATSSQRFQVKISSQWNDYGPKEDDALKLAFDNFVRKRNDQSLVTQDFFKELVIKGRRYVVDFNKMVQVRKDNKKDYKVRPPQGSAPGSGHGQEDGLRDEGHLQLNCEYCKGVYNLRQVTARSEETDWADCHFCQDCWRPRLDKEEKKVEKIPKPRQVQQPCGTALTTLEKTVSSPLKQASPEVVVQRCAYCDQPFRVHQAVFLGAFSERCQPCHKLCDPEAVAKVKLYCEEYSKSEEHLFSGVTCERNIMNLRKDDVCYAPEISGF